MVTKKERNNRRKIFILEDDTDYCRLLQGYLGGTYDLYFVSTFREACNAFNQDISLALIDICLDRNDPDNKDGLKFINFLREEGYDVPVIVLSGYEQQDMPEVIRESFKSGAIDYIRKSRLTPAYLRQLISDTLVKFSLRNQVRHWKRRAEQVGGWRIIGECPQIQRIKEEILRVAEDGVASVLITGETGVGKELVANAIHTKGWRSEGPFVTVNVTALPAELVHRELFGHEKGAFTGAEGAVSGYIEKANGGILFLDEVGELPDNAQKMLLRVLEERLVFRLGGTRGRKVDFQLVTATNRNLKEEASANRFRPDLYYRLSGYVIELTPLRERGDDILLLANYFLEQFRKQGRTRSKGFSSEVERILLNYSWPGNIRELRNVVERAVIRTGTKNDGLIDSSVFPTELVENAELKKGQWCRTGDLSFPIDIKRELALKELQCLEAALKQAGGRRTEMWKYLKGFNNRFTPPRKVKELLKRYPEFMEAVPYLIERFKKDLEAPGAGATNMGGTQGSHEQK